MKGLPPSAKKVFGAYIILLFLFADLIILGLFLFRLINGYAFSFLLFLGFGLFCAFYFYLVPKYYYGYEYSCTSGGLTINKGFLLRRQITLLKEKVSYAEIYSNPLQKRFFICSVGFFCPGTGRVLLSQIDLTEAEKIKELFCDTEHS